MSRPDLAGWRFVQRTTKAVAEEPAFAGFATNRKRIEKKTEAKEPGTRGSAMALVQYQQITGGGLGNAPGPSLRLGPNCRRWRAE